MELEKKTGWKAFMLRPWQPEPSIRLTIFLFIFFGVFLLILGIAITVMNGKVIEGSILYSDICYDFLNKTCTVIMKLEEEMKPPIFMFYELTNFYQNHRRYLKSRSSSQLQGEIISSSDAESACDPVVYNKHLNVKVSYKNVTLDPDAVANPCGLMAKSIFNDTFSVVGPKGNTFNIKNKGITWPSDIGKKFKKCDKSEEIQWMNPEDEHFIVWMRAAGLKDFRKLWGRIDETMEKGTYAISIANNYNSSSFAGTKTLVFSTASGFGGKNRFLAVSYIVVGILCLIIGFFFWAKRSMSGGKFGTVKQD